MKEFKLKDKVKVITCYFNENIKPGSTGIIVSFISEESCSGSYNYIGVAMDNYFAYPLIKFFEDEIELV